MYKHSGWIEGPANLGLSKFIVTLARTNDLNISVEGERSGWWIFKKDRVIYSVQGEDWRGVHNFIIAVRGYANKTLRVRSSTDIISLYGI